MRMRLALIALTLALLNLTVLAPIAYASAPGSDVAAPSAASPIPVTGTITDALGNPVGTFTGTLKLDHFANQNGQLVAVGKLTGTLTNLLGVILGTITDFIVTLPVTNIHGTCDILHLELGPLDLDLLGLVVHLDKVVLDISAQSGSGELLGNLLCAIAHLLDTNGPLDDLVSLLNQLLDQLT